RSSLHANYCATRQQSASIRGDKSISKVLAGSTSKSNFPRIGSSIPPLKILVRRVSENLTLLVDTVVSPNDASRSVLRVEFAHRARRHAHHAPEGAVECRFGLVADAFGDLGERVRG